MTRTEYRSLKSKGQSLTAKQVQDKLRKVRAMYVEAGKRAGRVISRLPGGTLSERSREKIISAIDRESIYKEIVGYIDEGRNILIRDAFDVDRRYVADAFAEAGKTVDLSEMFDRQAERINQRYEVKNNFIHGGIVECNGNVSISDGKQILLSRDISKTIEDLILGNLNEEKKKCILHTRMTVKNRKKYGLQPSIWASIDEYSDIILTIVETELKGGIDPAQIAKDIDRYIKAGKGGRDFIKGKWGKLQIDEPDAIRRLGRGGIDYRTQRVVRTELYTARRDSDIQAGRMNPGATNLFNWRLGPTSTDVCDICRGWASGGPYTSEKIQSLQDDSHPNCFCSCNPVLKDRDEFVQSLRDYVRGDDTPGAAEIDAWAAKYGFSE